MAIITSEEKQSDKNADSVLVGPGGPWHERAPLHIRRFYQLPADERGWAAWCKHLAKRKFCPIGSLLAGKRSALTWALPEGLELDQTFQLIETLHKLDGSPPKTDRKYPVLRYPRKWGYSPMAGAGGVVQNVFTQEHQVLL